MNRHYERRKRRYQLVVAKGDIPCLIGNPRLIREPLYKYPVGHEFTQIGKPGRNGGFTSSHRHMRFVTPITYCGKKWLDNGCGGRSLYALFDSGTYMGGIVYIVFIIPRGGRGDAFREIWMQKFNNQNLYTFKL